MIVAVTGASGHIGINLLPKLIEEGYEVRVLVHKNDKAFEGFDVSLIKGDLLNKESLVEFINGAKIVIHLAGIITLEKRSEEVLKVNIDGTKNLLEASKELGVGKFIFFSSIHALNVFPLSGVMDETRELNTHSPFDYDKSKVQGERMVLEASQNGLHCVILNPTAVLGPHDYKPSQLGKAIIQYYKGKIPALLNGGYNFVDVRDVADATIQAINQDKNGQRYIVSGNWESIRHLGDTIHKFGGKKPPKLTVPFWLARSGAGILNYFSTGKDDERLFAPASLDTLEHSHRNISHEKATQDMGYRPLDFDKTIEDTVKWFKLNNYME
jgi:dihydroflavonol-4-reductase